MGKKKLWIRKVVEPHEKGALHRQLGVPQDKTIPKSLVKKIVASPIGKTVKNPTKTGKKSMKVTTLLKQRANFALNVGYGKYPRKK